MADPTIDAGVAARSWAWVFQSWLRLWLVIAAALLGVLALYQGLYFPAKLAALGRPCAWQSFIEWQPGSCQIALWASLTLPDAAVWLDNLFVEAYSIVFVLAALDARGVLTRRPSLGDAKFDWLLAAVVLCVLLGAAADHAENFWLLAHVGEEPAPSLADFAIVSQFTAWKFRLFTLNALIAVLSRRFFRGSSTHPAPSPDHPANRG